MNIFAIGLNYREHILEFGGEIPEEPVFFMKSSTAYLPNGKPFFYPDFSKAIDYELELVLKVGRLGKSINESFALNYISEVTVGIDLTARDIQSECRKQGLPWEKSKSFDGSAPVGRFIPVSEAGNLSNADIQLLLNGNIMQKGNTSDMIFSIPQIISYLSRFFTLQIGDLIFTGTPPGIGSVSIGDRLEGSLNSIPLLDFQIK